MIKKKSVCSWTGPWGSVLCQQQRPLWAIILHPDWAKKETTLELLIKRAGAEVFSHPNGEKMRNSCSPRPLALAESWDFQSVFNPGKLLFK